MIYMYIYTYTYTIIIIHIYIYIYIYKYIYSYNNNQNYFQLAISAGPLSPHKRDLTIYYVATSLKQNRVALSVQASQDQGPVVYNS